MSATAESSGGFWRSVRQLPGRTSLRVKLISALLALVTVALALSSVVGISVLKNYVLDQADAQLQSDLAYYSQNLRQYLFYGGGASPSGTAVYWKVPGHQPQPLVAPGTGLGSGVVPGPQIRTSAGWLTNGKMVTVPAASGPSRWRVVAYRLEYKTTTGEVGTGTVIVGVNVDAEYATIGRLARIDLLVSLLVILVLAVVGVAVVRASLRPLTDIELTAEVIAAGDISRRVPDRDPRTEVGRLGRSLNLMLSQIEAAFHAQSRSEIAARRSEERLRQFVADASHELRTPLTAIRGFAEYYRQLGGIGDGNGHGSGHLAPADLDRIMRRVEQESSRMGVLVEDMLLLARMDQQRPLEQRTVDLLTLAADAVHDARVVAPSRSINLTVSAGAALLVVGDEVRLRQVIGNLMSNALSHTPEGTPIDVRIRSGRLDEARGPAQPPGPPANSGPWSAAVLEVADHGAGLTREQIEHVFERFYRADAARTTGGNGLGLAIVAALVAAHGGAVWAESAPGAGATFRIALPLAPEARHEAEYTDDSEDDLSLVQDTAAETDTADSGSASASDNSSEDPGTEHYDSGDHSTDDTGPIARAGTIA